MRRGAMGFSWLVVSEREGDLMKRKTMYHNRPPDNGAEGLNAPNIITMVSRDVCARSSEMQVRFAAGMPSIPCSRVGVVC